MFRNDKSSPNLSWETEAQRREVTRAGHLGGGVLLELGPPFTEFFFFFNVLFIFERGRERRSRSRGGAERDTHIEFEAGSRL